MVSVVWVGVTELGVSTRPFLAYRKLPGMADYRRAVISDGALVFALVALVNDIKPHLRKVVDIYKITPRFDVYSLQIHNLIFKMSDTVRFTVLVLNQCAAEVCAVFFS